MKKQEEHLKMTSTSTKTKINALVMNALSTIVILCAFYFGCSKKDEGLIYGYLNSVEPYLDSTKLQRFKYSENDSILHRFSELYHSDPLIWNDSLQFVQLLPFFDTIEIVELEENSLYYLCFALYDKIRGLPFDNAKILERCNPMILERQKVRDKNLLWSKMLYDEEMKTMKENDQKGEIGNIFFLTFKAKNTNGSLEASYDPAYSSTDELTEIKLRGILVEKEYHFNEEEGKRDTLGIEYKLKITQLNYNRFTFYERIYQEGDTFELDLRAYKKPL